MQYTSELKPLNLEEIADAAKGIDAYRIYLHWSAGHYGQAYEDYHLCIDHNGRIYACDNNLDFDRTLNHTWHRNTGSIGIAVLGCYGAKANNGYDADLGDEPVTQAQVEALSAVVATICKHGGIDVENVLTHCEIAQIDGYGVPYGQYVKCTDGSIVYQGDTDLRWDLWYLQDSADGEMKSGGDVIRGKARFYYEYV